MSVDFLETDQPRAARAQPFSAGNIVLLLGILAVIVVIGWQLLRSNEGTRFSGAAPDFSVNLYSSDDVFTLAEQRGQVVVVNFWGSWCAPCRDEAPELQAVYADYRERGVQFVGVGYLDVEPAAVQFIQDFGLTYPNGADEGSRITASYGVGGVPETFIIGRDGTIQHVFVGPVNAETLRAALDTVLAGESETQP